MPESKGVPGKPTQLLFDEDLELERQEEEDQLKKRTAQIRRRQIYEAQRKVRMRKIRLTILGVTVGLLLGVFSLRFFHVYPFWVPSHKPTAEQLQVLTKQWLVFAVESIELFRAKNQRLPATLLEAGVSTNPAWSYRVLSDERYIVSITQDGVSASFDSVDDPKKFLASPKRK
jgi:hypothetical protein